jgi:microcystin-dependent protein
MPIPALRVQQSTDTTGYGSLVLNYGPTSARNFIAAFGSSAARVRYCISWSTGFEIGIGTFDGGSPGSLARSTIVASSNAGAAVALPAGVKDVFAWLDPADRPVLSLSASATLTAADAGNLVLYTGSGGATVTLPASTALPIGASIIVRHLNGPNEIYVSAATGDGIDSTYVILAPGHSVTLTLAYPGYWTGMVTAPPRFGRAVGEVFAFAGPYQPPLSLWCNGQAVLRSAYPALFAAISTTYGEGNGTTTFNVPDLRGRAIFGADAMGGYTAGRVTTSGSGITGWMLGAAGGHERMQAHTHSISDPGHTHTAGTAAGGTGSAAVETPGYGAYQAIAAGGNHAHGVNVSAAATGISGTNSAGDGGSQNMPPTMTLNLVIFAGA